MSKSYQPQNVCDAAWYYENDGSIDLILNPERLGVSVVKPLPSTIHRRKGVRYASGDGICIRIPSAMLLKTLRRQGRA